MKVNQLKIGVILSYLSKMITIVIGLVYTPLMIRLLGQSEYGLYNIAASVISYLGVLNLGFGSAYMRFYSRYKVANEDNKISTLNGMFLIIFSVLGTIAVFAGLILVFNVNIIFGPSLTKQELRLAQILMGVLVINLGVSFPNIIFSTYIQANERFLFANGLEIIKQVSMPLVTLPVLITGHGSIGMVIVTTSINILVELVNIYYSVKKLDMHFSFNNFDIELLKEMSVYSFFIFINMLVDQVNQNLDKTIIGRYGGTIVTAVYSVGERFELIYQQLSIAIASVFTPKIHNMISQNTSNEIMTVFFTRVGRIQFIILSLILSGFAFFGRPFIGIWAGVDYYNAFPIALLLMTTITIPLIQNVGIEIQRAKNMHQFRSWLYLFMAVANLIITIPLVKKFGGFGAAIGTSLSYIIGNGLLMNLYNHLKVGLDMKYFWKEIASFTTAFILPVSFALVVNHFLNLYNIWNLLFSILIYTMIFVISMWNFGLNRYEKELIKNITR